MAFKNRTTVYFNLYVTRKQDRKSPHGGTLVARKQSTQYKLVALVATVTRGNH
jgi:hypothetical protein